MSHMCFIKVFILQGVIKTIESTKYNQSDDEVKSHKTEHADDLVVP